MRIILININVDSIANRNKQTKINRYKTYIREDMFGKGKEEDEDENENEE